MRNRIGGRRSGKTEEAKQAEAELVAEARKSSIDAKTTLELHGCRIIADDSVPENAMKIVSVGPEADSPGAGPTVNVTIVYWKPWLYSEWTRGQAEVRRERRRRDKVSGRQRHTEEEDSK